jgi:hypothetical protein
VKWLRVTNGFIPAARAAVMIARYFVTAALLASLSRAFKFEVETVLPIFTELVLEGKILDHSIPIRQLFIPSALAFAMSEAKFVFQPPGPFSG